MEQIIKFSNALCKAIKIRTNVDSKSDRYGKIYCFEVDHGLSVPLPGLLWIKININQSFQNILMQGIYVRKETQL